jgi:RNA polymerase sigma-70 factor (sigma-E family)
VSEEEPASADLEDLYRRHSNSAFGFAFLLTGDRHAAQDLVQEAFVRMVGRFDHLRHRGAFDAYLRKTVLNLFLSSKRRARLERAHAERERAIAVTPSVQPDIAAREDLWRALLELPPRQRAALVLRYYEDMSEQRTADVMGTSVAAVKSLVQRGTEAMRTRIGREP